MASQPSPASHPDQARVRRRRPPSRQYSSAAPIGPSGHQPHGGSEKARRTPAATEGTATRPRCGSRLTRARAAAARPLAMQAGTPTPRYAAPATATPPSRATAASSPAVRSRWCTRYCGRATGVAHDERVRRVAADPHERAAARPRSARRPRRRSTRPGACRRCGRARRGRSTSPSRARCGHLRSRKVPAVTAQGSRPLGGALRRGTRNPVPWSDAGTWSAPARNVTTTTEA